MDDDDHTQKKQKFNQIKSYKSTKTKELAVALRTNGTTEPGEPTYKR